MVSGSGATTSMTGPARDPEPGIAELIRDVREVIRLLEGPAAHEPLRGVVEKCNASLEHCLESGREKRERDASAGTARDDLKRLAGLLGRVEPADTVMVLRQIRRVLGRFDVRV
jgi:hypothetical protein